MYEAEDYYKPLGVDNFWSKTLIEYESSFDKNKTLSVKKISEYNQTIVKRYHKWSKKIQLTISINFISSKDNDGC